jgi:hypothetical protein
MNPNDMVQLVFTNIHENLLIPMVSKNSSNIPPWNRRVDDYIVAIFDFVKTKLASKGVMLLCHSINFKIFKEVMSYLESYGF